MCSLLLKVEGRSAGSEQGHSCSPRGVDGFLAKIGATAAIHLVGEGPFAGRCGRCPEERALWVTGGVSMCPRHQRRKNDTSHVFTEVSGTERRAGLQGPTVRGALAVRPRPSERFGSPPGGGLRVFQLHVGRLRVALGSGEPPCPFLDG